ncbi:hypothetical protein [Brevundimonas sp.]|jgi:hypothetical protein|uniref:hypothetical protein n=1 Tax=Brevundimonas sp. TaxID=1871086 RepID=UPI00257AA286|nr:hypothetical protein [Brevundimonas sp.]|tara:strand:- start:528 stop:1154 length:627 start_codon:yes stop_codon:yes gene_type:complete
MQNRTYTELFSLIKSLAGVNEFTPEETNYIRDFANRRFYEAFEITEAWPRYLVVGEARTATNGVVPVEEGSKSRIGQFLRIHRNKPFLRNSEVEYDFYVDFSGAHIINEIGGSEGTSEVYVTYKREFNPILGYASSPGVQSVPNEFFYYIAHSSYADFLRMDGQVEKALIEEKVGEKYLDIELSKLEILVNNNNVGKRISTYVNKQSR